MVEPKKVVELSKAILKACNDHDLETTLTVLTNITGQLLVGLTGGAPYQVEEAIKSFSENVKRAAQMKMIHDAEIKKNTKVN